MDARTLAHFGGQCYRSVDMYGNTHNAKHTLHLHAVKSMGCTITCQAFGMLLLNLE